MRVRSLDAEIFYEQIGAGPDLVLLHPFPAHHGIWMPVAEALASRYRLLLPDLRGHGDSQVGEGPATMEKHAADVLNVCQAAGVRRALFAGNSIGGYVLFEFWRRYRDRVAALILCDTRAQADTPEARARRLQSAEDVLRRGTEPFIESMLPKLLGKTTFANRPDVVDAVRRMAMKMSPAGIAAVQRGMAERPDSLPTLATVDVPTLIMVGDEDTVSPPADAELMRAHIRGSTLRVVPRAGHYPPFEQPEVCTAAIREFLDSMPRLRA